MPQNVADIGDGCEWSSRVYPQTRLSFACIHTFKPDVLYIFVDTQHLIQDLNQEIPTPARGIMSIKFSTRRSRRDVEMRQQCYIVVLSKG